MAELASSGTGMGRVVDGSESITGHVCVDLGRRKIAVAEQLLPGTKIRPSLEKVRSVRVTEGVRVEGASVGQRVALEDAPGISRREPSAALVEEHDVGR